MGECRRMLSRENPREGKGGVRSPPPQGRGVDRSRAEGRRTRGDGQERGPRMHGLPSGPPPVEVIASVQRPRCMRPLTLATARRLLDAKAETAGAC